MRKTFLFSIGLIGGALLLSSFVAASAGVFKIPKKADAVVQAKCWGCHSEEGRSDKAKEKLRWDQLGDLSAEEQLEKFKKIQTVLEEGSMPPARMVERNPEMKLTDEDVATMQKWATKMTKKLSK